LFLCSAFAQTPNNTLGFGAKFLPETEFQSFRSTAQHRSFLPPVVDLTKFFPRPRSQGSQGSCVGWAVGYAARAYYNAAIEGKKLQNPANIPSPAYIYNMINETPGDCSQGTYVRDALELLKTGSVSLKDYSYSSSRCSRPSSKIQSNAKSFKIKNWLRVNHRNLDQIKAELSKKHPVVIVLITNGGFNKLRDGNPWRAGPANGRDGEAHAVTLVGYSEQRQAFKFINSWGTNWGLGGFGRMTYDTFRNRVKEAYVMRIATPSPVVPKPKPVNPRELTTELNELSCGNIKIETHSDGSRQVVGYVGTDKDLKTIRSKLAGKIDNINVDIRPWPQCETLQTLESPLGYKSQPRIDLSQKSFVSGDALVFDIITPNFESYLHVAYVQADGNVVNLKQANPLDLKITTANTKITLGDGSNSGPKFTIVEPYGSEMLIVVASKSPLFQQPRPLVETERAFLTALRKAILYKPDAQSTDRIVSANFVAFKTNKNGIK